jgi:hypothetical protein
MPYFVFAMIASVLGNINPDNTFPLLVSYTIVGRDVNGVPVVFGGETNIAITIPVGLSHRKSDETIRRNLVTDILNRLSITVDPDDIYFPMSS